MAKLDQIYISGIRSYGIGKSDAQTLEFYSPVTLLLGQNGCGKTTVIESIKHALTGDFPAGGKSGQLFVSDPILYNESSIKGCIKLKFLDIYGKPATISRTLRVDVVNQVTRQVRYKSADASYEYFDRDGTQHSISAKLQDCKDLIEVLIGVPEAVLNNVLLCHQEDSLWPLSEDSNVKKKFDQIFDSARYDRAVDGISKSIKAHATVMNSLKKDLGYLKEIKQSAQQKRNLLKEKTASLDTLNEKKEDYHLRITPLRELLQGVIALEEDICALKNLKSEFTNKLITNQKYQIDLKELLKTVFDGSDEELDNAVKNFHILVDKKGNELKHVEKNISQLTASLKYNSQEEHKKRSTFASLQEQLKTLRSRTKERDDCAHLLLTKYNILPAESFESNYRNVQVAVQVEQKRLSLSEGKFKDVERQAQEEVDTANMKYLEVKNREVLKEQERDAAVAEKRQTQSQLEDLSGSDVEFKNIEGKITRVDQEISQIQSSFNEDADVKSIETNKKRVRVLNETLEDLEKEMKNFVHNAMIEKEIEHFQSDKLNKEKDIRTLKNKHHDEFKHLFDQNIPTHNFKSELETVRQKHDKLLKAQQKDYEEREKLSPTLNAKLSVLKNELESYQQEYQSSRQAIEKFCKLEDFDAKRDSVELENGGLQKEKGQLSAMKYIYKKFLTEFCEQKSCPLCETDFAAKQADHNKVALAMKAKIENIPTRLANVTMQLERGEVLFNALTELKPTHAKMTRLENILEAKRIAVTAMEGEYNKVRKELNLAKAAIAKRQYTLEMCNQVRPDATMIDQYSEDIAKHAGKISALHCKLIVSESNLTEATAVTAKHDVKEEICRLTDENERLSKRISVNQTRLHKCRTQKAELIESQLKWQKMVHDKPQLIIKEQELEKKINALNAMIEAAENDSLNALTDLEEGKNKLATIKSDNAKEIDNMRNVYQNHNSDLKDIEKLKTEVGQMEKHNLDVKCTDMEGEIQLLVAKRTDIEMEWRQFQAQRELLKDELRDQDASLMSLRNNQKIRELANTEVTLERKILGVTREIDNKDYYAIQTEKVKLQRDVSNLLTDMANNGGQITALQENIADIEADLASYKTDPHKLYIEKVYEIEFMKLAIEELRRTHDSLSLAICRYHREQLMSINEQLRDLWRTIYQGNDIDYIQIDSGETQLSSSRRQYSYCINQVKGGVKMPMRGKCSAGQKVLSCLLLRMSLALHFSTSCGIFALDEPTTNLDRDNIKSLSQAIAKLISRRHLAEENFQFLIITHDVEFLTALREEDAIREYYRVSRNAKGNSVITQEVI